MSARALIAVPAGAVAAGAVLATGHGLHAVALAAGVEDPIAWLYPVITDGLALVAYVAAHHVPQHKSYAWAVVLVSAVMSGVAQAVFLAGAALDASAGLRFAMGAWPAVAALLGGHLLYLLFRAWADADAAAEAKEAAARAHAAAERYRALEEARLAEQARAEQDRPDAQIVTMPRKRSQPPTRRTRASADDVDQAKAAKLVEQGMGRKALARELGTTLSVARTLIARYGGTDTDAEDGADEGVDVDERESVNA